MILECPEKLIKLLSRAAPGSTTWFRRASRCRTYDVYCAPIDVPGLVATSIEKTPNRSSLHPPRSRAGRALGNELSRHPGVEGRDQLAGQSQVRGRPSPLDPVGILRAASTGAGSAALQPSEERRGRAVDAQIAGKFEVTELGSRLDVDTGPFMDTAAVMKCLDLFITSDTAVAHLAGSLGVPVWMALSTTPDWRWLSVREDNPWYPTMRIFRQQKFMEWVPVFDRIAVELRKTVPSTVPTPSVAVETAPGELIDKITILEIKAERMGDPEKVRNVRTELDTLRRARDRTILAVRGARVADGRAALGQRGVVGHRRRDPGAASERRTSARSSSSWRGRSTSTMTTGRRSSGRSMCCWGRS